MSSIVVLGNSRRRLRSAPTNTAGSGGGGGAITGPQYTLPKKANGSSIGWDEDTNGPAEDLWDYRTVPTVTGTTHNVANQTQFNTALTNAVYGDEIVVTAGVTLDPITLPSKSWSSGWITIRVANAATNLPAGTRVVAADAADMFTIRSTATNGTAITAASGARNYRFIGARITNTSGVNNTSSLVDFTPGTVGVSSAANLPKFVVFDRCYFEGASTGQRRGWAPGGEDQAAIDCRFENFTDLGGSDSQAVCTWDYIKRLALDNCFLEASSENVMWGGADPATLDGVPQYPQDIVIRKCHFYKRSAWTADSYNVKHLFENKNAERLLIWGCVFENNYEEDQNHILNIQAVNQSGGAGYADYVKCKDFTIWCCKGIGTQAGNFLVITEKYNTVTEGTRRVEVAHCLWPDVTSTGGNGNLVLIGGVCPQISLHHLTIGAPHTVLHVDTTAVGTYAAGHGLEFRDNISIKNTTNGFRVNGSNNPAASGYNTVYGSNNWRVSHNVYLSDDAGPASGGTPDCTGTNQQAANLAAIQFVNAAGGDYTLAAGSPYKGDGSDGRDPGCDIATLNTAISGVT